MSDSTRPKDTTRSYRLVWEGTNPVIEESNWAPGYTEAHMESVEDAVKYGMHKLTRELAEQREKWVKINALIAAMVEQDEKDGI